MSISAKLSDIRTAISSAYTAVSNMGGTVPALPTLNALPSAIQTIPTGGGGDSELNDFAIRSFKSTYNISEIGAGLFAYTSLSSINLPNCTYVGSSAFVYCSSLSSISLPNCTYVDNSAFYSCSSLSSISLPNCSYVGSYAFYSCLSLSSISLPNCIGIYDNAFSPLATNLSMRTELKNTLQFSLFEVLGYNILGFNPSSFSPYYNSYILSTSVIKYIAGSWTNSAKLSTISLPNCTVIGTAAFYRHSLLASVYLPICLRIESMAFASCSSRLTRISLPNCTVVGNAGFIYCSKLSSVSLPVCSRIEQTAFYGCRSLTSISLPNCSYVGAQAFQSAGVNNISLPVCTFVGSSAFNTCRLLSISLPLCSHIGGGAFASCSSLSVIYLGSSKCFLEYSSAFSSTLIWSDKGSIFVKSAYYDYYKTSTNWTYFSNRIFSY